MTSVKPGEFVSVDSCTPTTPARNCLAGFQSNCLHGSGYDGCQAELIRVPNADGTLVATPGEPAEDLIPSLLALSDVMSHRVARRRLRRRRAGHDRGVVGDGAVGLSGVLAAASSAPSGSSR